MTKHVFEVGDLVRIKKNHRLESDHGSTRGVVFDTHKVDECEWGPEYNAHVVFTDGKLRGERYWIAFESLKSDA